MAETLQHDPTADELASVRRELEQKLGRCLLGLQRYELLMKAIASDYAVAGRVDKIEANVARQSAKFERKTLGDVVGYVVGGYIAHQDCAPRDPVSHIADEPGAFIAARIQQNVTDDEFKEVTARLSEFVTLRNNLIHHFLDTHDLTNVAGCLVALETLATASVQIEQHVSEAKSWLEDLVETKKYFGEILRSEAFATMLDGQMKASVDG